MQTHTHMHIHTRTHVYAHKHTQTQNVKSINQSRKQLFYWFWDPIKVKDCRSFLRSIERDRRRKKAVLSCSCVQLLNNWFRKRKKDFYDNNYCIKLSCMNRHNYWKTCYHFCIHTIAWILMKVNFCSLGFDHVLMMLYTVHCASDSRAL